MPIYEFRCTECDEVSEEMLSFKDKKKTIKCPVCGNIAEKILSLGSFHLKGSGWYSDGYEGKMQKMSREEVEKNKITCFLRKTPAKTYSFWKVYGLSRTGNKWGLSELYMGK